MKDSSLTKNLSREDLLSRLHYQELLQLRRMLDGWSIKEMKHVQSLLVKSDEDRSELYLRMGLELATLGDWEILLGQEIINREIIAMNCLYCGAEMEVLKAGANAGFIVCDDCYNNAIK